MARILFQDDLAACSIAAAPPPKKIISGPARGMHKEGSALGYSQGGSEKGDGGR